MADLEDLLNEALQDFGAAAPQRPGGQVPEQSTTAPSGQPPVAGGTSATQGGGQQDASSDAAAGSSGAAAPSGLGRSLPARPGAKKPAAAGSAAPSDPLGKASGDAGPGPASAAGAGAAKAPGPPLTPAMQKLADDLLKLVEESGIGGEGEPAGGPEDEEGLQELLGSDAFHALAQQLQNVVGGAGGLPDLAGLGLGGLAGEFGSLPGGAEAAAAGPRGPGAGGEEESVRSATLRGLMQQTKATVEKQSKYTRGETSGSSAAGGGRGGPSPGGFPFGDLLGKDGPLGSLMGAGGEGGSGMNMMVDFIMQNLLSKDVLYGPLKEIRDKYPPWLESDAAKALPEEEMARYRAQFAALQQVCDQYENDPANFSRLVELIQEMQKHGDPPAAIVDDISGSIQSDLGSIPTGGPASTEPLDEEDLANMKIPPDLLKDLPQELQKECVIC